MLRSWWLPAGLLLALAGYFGPWVDHAAAGLVITGLDLGEYVKFLPVVRTGGVTLWRPGFYAPLAAIALAATLSAYRPVFWPRPILRVIPIAVGLVAAFNLVPPAWTPARLLEPEFRIQTTALLLLLAATAVSPFLALIPHRITAGIVTVMAAAGLALPLHGFLAVRPAIAQLYAQPLGPAWGPWIMALGHLLIVAAMWFTRARPDTTAYDRGAPKRPHATPAQAER